MNAACASSARRFIGHRSGCRPTIRPWFERRHDANTNARVRCQIRAASLGAISAARNAARWPSQGTLLALRFTTEAYLAAARTQQPLVYALPDPPDRSAAMRPTHTLCAERGLV